MVKQLFLVLSCLYARPVLYLFFSAVGPILLFAVLCLGLYLLDFLVDRQGSIVLTSVSPTLGRARGCHRTDTAPMPKKYSSGTVVS